MNHLFRRAGATLAASALVVAAAATPASAASAPASAGPAASWIAGQLDHGLMHNAQYDYDDYGLSVDAALALKAIGGHPTAVHHVRRAVKANVESYTGSGTERYAGSLAKTAVLAQISGGGARHFGGVNLVKRLVGQTYHAGPSKGRIHDTSQYGDYANVVGQSLAVRALGNAGAPYAKAARDYLLLQQCSQGFFRQDFAQDRTVDQRCGKAGKSAPSVDTTAYALIQLSALQHRGPKVRAAIHDAARWLAAHQRDNGVVTTGGTGNTNSTGLSAWALHLAGRDHAAARAARWVGTLQTLATSGKLAGDRGAIAFDKAGLEAGRADGITTQTRDQWRRATTQAAPSLTLLP